MKYINIKGNSLNSETCENFHFKFKYPYPGCPVHTVLRSFKLGIRCQDPSWIHDVYMHGYTGTEKSTEDISNCYLHLVADRQVYVRSASGKDILTAKIFIS